jgi:hypothetical protein
MPDMPPISTILEQSRNEAEFEVVLLTDLQGGIAAAARSDGATPEMLGALLDVAQRIAARPDDRAKLAAAGESTFFDWEGRRVICRWLILPTTQEPHLLVVLAPHGKAYKRAISQLAKELRQLASKNHSD